MCGGSLVVTGCLVVCCSIFLSISFPLFVKWDDPQKNPFYRTSKKVAVLYRGVDKSLARPGRKQATATEDFEFHILYL